MDFLLQFPRHMYALRTYFCFCGTQERPATLILTVTSGLRITRARGARQVYNRDTETGS